MSARAGVREVKRRERRAPFAMRSRSTELVEERMVHFKHFLTPQTKLFRLE